MEFTKPPVRLEEIFRLITKSPTGRDVMEAFLPHYQSGRVKFVPYPREIVARLQEVVGADMPIGACFVTDGHEGTIHFDANSPLGVLAPFLVHEMVHSLDRSIWANALKPNSKRAKGKAADKARVDAEVAAFEAQVRFTQELKDAVPGYREFLAGHFEKAKILHERLSGDEIESLYVRKRSKAS